MIRRTGEPADKRYSTGCEEKRRIELINRALLARRERSPPPAPEGSEGGNVDVSATLSTFSARDSRGDPRREIGEIVRRNRENDKQTGNAGESRRATRDEAARD